MSLLFPLRSFLRRHPLVMPVLMLALATLAGGLLLAARIVISHRLRHLYLPWNLFLAWLPVPAAFAARFFANRNLGPRWLPWLFGAVWLAFLPNAPYLLTDLVHLPDPTERHYFADMMLILHFALVGVALGVVSLHVMHDLVERRCGWWRGWTFVSTVAGLTGLGIYFGRFLRWNSWELVTHPLGLTIEFLEWSAHVADRPSELILPALFGSTTLLAYVLFSSFLRPSRHDPWPASQELLSVPGAGSAANS